MIFQHIAVNLNDRCSLACKYCFYEDRSNEEMSLDTAKSTAEFIRSIEGKQVWFFGSEPTLSQPLMEKITVHIRSVLPKASFGATSNLVILNDDLLNLWKKYRFHINASYDGAWHDEYRVFKDGSSSEKKVRTHLKKLMKTGILFTVLMSMVPGAEEKFLDGIKQTYGLGAKGIVMNKVVDGYPVEYDWDKVGRAFFCITKWYAEAYRKDPKFVLQFLHRSMTQKPTTGRKRWTCGACQGSIAVQWNGDVVICHRAAGEFFKIGDVWEGLNEDRVNYFRNQIGYWRCPNCALREECSICYVIGKNKTGDILHPPDNYCRWEFAKRQAAIYLRRLLSPAPGSEQRSVAR